MSTIHDTNLLYSTPTHKLISIHTIFQAIPMCSLFQLESSSHTPKNTYYFRSNYLIYCLTKSCCQSNISVQQCCQGYTTFQRRPLPFKFLSIQNYSSEIKDVSIHHFIYIYRISTTLVGSTYIHIYSLKKKIIEVKNIFLIFLIFTIIKEIEYTVVITYDCFTE